MTPILGIMASQISGHLYTPTGSMYHIATTTLGTATADVTFSSIPADYTHLQVRANSRATGIPSGTSFNLLQLQFNSNTGNNYAYHFIEANGSTIGVTATTSTNLMGGSIQAGSVQTTSVFGVSVIDILDYTNTNKNTTIRGLGGADNNGSGSLGYHSGVFLNTAAITSIKLTPQANNFDIYSSFSLYGVK